MADFVAFTDEQARALINLEQRYHVWIEASRGLAALPYDLRRKKVGEYSYLYEIFDREGNGKSRGSWDDKAESRFNAYRAEKQALKERLSESRRAMEESGQLCRALRVPSMASEAIPILVEADRRGMLDGSLLVVGTNAIPAYAIEAGGAIRDVPDETEDFDLAWAGAQLGEHNPSVINLLKSVDPTFTVNSERIFQARNARAYEVEILIAPSRAESYGRREPLRPTPLPEQEWLLKGRPVDRVVPGRNGQPARVVAPDPRWFALHKLWLAKKAERHPLKRTKDGRQGAALLDVVAARMPHYPLDRSFRKGLPKVLLSHFDHWFDARDH